jgi:hypothetical protein
VIEPRLGLPHRVLVAPEQGQAVLDEVVERHCCAWVGGQRPIEVIQRTGMRRKTSAHQVDDLARDGVWRESPWRRHPAWTTRIETAAIFRIKVPLPAQRLLALHQYLMALPLPAIEPLHAPFAFALGPLGEVRRRTQEMPIHTSLVRDARAVHDLSQRLLKMKLAGVDPADTVRLQHTYILV